MTFFHFEHDFIKTLRCIPMSVRQKLDLSGVKLKLHQWGAFSLDQRQTLVTLPCTTATEINHYREYLCQMIEITCQEPAKCFTPDRDPSWQQGDHIPAEVREKALQEGITLTLAFWQTLTPLQRFALVKLSRPSHENANFWPALTEFGWDLFPPDPGEN
ncbi:MAG: nitrate reductase associated protein [Synechococcales cyanobacterium]